MNDVSDILRALLDQYTSADEVERVFTNMLNEDTALRNDYKEWCDANGFDYKTGYQDYLDELKESLDPIWDEMSE